MPILVDAQFAWARLAHADFTGASGLLGGQFARADLRGSRMPSSVRFGAFETANEMAEGTGKLFLTVLLICAYSWLTINSTVDRQLLTDTAVSKLPILNADIPIVNFYALVPIALVGLAVIALLQAQRLWSAIAAAPESLPDGTAMADRASVWLLGPWAAERLVPPHQAGALARLQAWLAIIVGWWLVLAYGGVVLGAVSPSSRLDRDLDPDRGADGGLYGGRRLPDPRGGDIAAAVLAAPRRQHRR